MCPPGVGHYGRVLGRVRLRGVPAVGSEVGDRGRATRQRHLSHPRSDGHSQLQDHG